MSAHDLTWQGLIDMIDQLDGSGLVVTDPDLLQKAVREVLGYDDDDYPGAER